MGEFERIDKVTNKEYGRPEYHMRQSESLRYTLNEKQTLALKTLQARLRDKLTAQKRASQQGALYSDAIVRPLNGEFAYFSSLHEGTLVDHAQALDLLKALQRFYEALSPDEISVLQLTPPTLKKKDIDLVRRFSCSAL